MFAVPVLGSRAGGSSIGDGGSTANGGQSGVKPSETIRQLYEFIQQFRLQEDFIYRCVAGLDWTGLVWTSSAVQSTLLMLSRMLLLLRLLPCRICRDRLRSNLLAKQYVLEVDLDHLIAYNEELANRMRETPADIMPLVGRLQPSHFCQDQPDGS